MMSELFPCQHISNRLTIILDTFVWKYEVDLGQIDPLSKRKLSSKYQALSGSGLREDIIYIIHGFEHKLMDKGQSFY